MIVADLDGTLLNQDREISNETVEYLKKLKNSGYIIVIATGRIYASALKSKRGSEFANYIIASTGTYIGDPSSESLIFKKTISKEIAKKILEYYNKNCKYIDICSRDMIYKYSEEEENTDIVKTIKDKKELLNDCKEIFHISIAMKDNNYVFELYHNLLEVIPELNILVMQDSFSDNKWIEIMPKECSKYEAIKILSNFLSIDNDSIIAFGDGINDIDMVEKCGIGVAIKNALPEVKAVANKITQYDYNQDGVIKFLKGFLDVE